MHEPTEQRIHKRRETPIGCLSPYMRTCVRTLLPLRAEHAEVGFVTPLGVFLSGGEKIVPLRLRRARLPLSGTVLLQKRNEPHP